MLSNLSTRTLRLLGWLAFALVPACESPPKAQAGLGAGAREAVSPLRFTPGVLSEYELSLSSKVRMGAGTELAEVSLSGLLQISAAPIDAGAFQALRISVAQPKLSGGGSGAETLTGVARELEAGFLVELAAGLVRAVRMPPGTSTFAANLARTLASNLQLGAGKVVRESDVSGTYDAEYVAEGGRLTKRKLRYDAVTVQSPSGENVTLTLTPEIVGSEGRIELADGALRSVTYTEKLKAQMMGSGEAVSETALSLRFATQRPTAPPSYEEWSARTIDVVTATPAALSREDTNLDRAVIADFTFDSALTTLAQLEDGPLPLLVTEGAKESPEAKKQREQRLALHNKAFAALSAILRTSPGAVDRAAELVRQSGSKRAFLLDVISGAETSEAQAALVELAQASELASDLRLRAVKNLSRSDKPDPETVRALLGWLSDRDHGVYAMYGLGTMARALRSRGQVELAAEATQALGARLERSRDLAERVHLLRSIANSGDAKLFELVRPLADDKNSSLRGAAIEAVRLMDHPDVDALIKSRLELEDNAVTLLSVLNAAKTRAPSSGLAAALSQIALHGKGEQARQRSVSVLASWLPKQPELRNALSEISEHDDSEDIRRIAKQALQTT